jgi:hypothetical protein
VAVEGGQLSVATASVPLAPVLGGEG